MPTLHDFRSNFRAGRTGEGLRAQPDARAYIAGLYDARNMMVLSNGDLNRRWGTYNRVTLDGETRLEKWEFAQDATTLFILAFQNAQLVIYDANLTEVTRFTGQPWTDTTKWFMTLAGSGRTLFIADQTMKTQVLEFDPAAGTFTLSDFEFKKSPSGRLYAPFYNFAGEDIVFTPTIFTSPGETAVYGPDLADALGILPSEYDIANGTGRLRTSAGFFKSEHLGCHLKLGDGECVVTELLSATEAKIRVVKTLAYKMPDDPAFRRQKRRPVEFSLPNHGLDVGDNVIMYGLSNTDGDRLSGVFGGMPRILNNADQPLDTIRTYPVAKIIDENTFEIDADKTVDKPDELCGGPGMYMIPADGFKECLEQGISDARGWPQACGIHENRLWVGGTTSLPDSLWASRQFNFFDFDTGDGSDNDAIAAYGLGEQARVRHILSGFDVLVFTDKGEFMIPGSSEVAITQSRVRAIPLGTSGTAYTSPVRFDGRYYAVDLEGHHIKEVASEGQELGYRAGRASIPIADWVTQPKHSAVYGGSPREVTPYTMFSQSTAGDILVMHSSQESEAFGFMRWDLSDGQFVSSIGINSQLFACAVRDGNHYLLEFDTSDAPIYADYAEVATDEGGGVWSVANLAGKTVQIIDGGQFIRTETLNGSGQIAADGTLTAPVFGLSMPWGVTMNAPMAASGQGSKMGKMQRLVSCEVHWINTVTGTVAEYPVIEDLDTELFQAPTPVNEWREYHIGEWDREPFLEIEGSEPGTVGMRAITLNVYF